MSKNFNIDPEEGLLFLKKNGEYKPYSWHVSPSKIHLNIGYTLVHKGISTTTYFTDIDVTPETAAFTSVVTAFRESLITSLVKESATSKSAWELANKVVDNFLEESKGRRLHPTVQAAKEQLDLAYYLTKPTNEKE